MGTPVRTVWAPERNAFSHMHGSASSGQAWDPMASSSVNFCWKKRTAPIVVETPSSTSATTLPPHASSRAWHIVLEMSGEAGHATTGKPSVHSAVFVAECMVGVSGVRACNHGEPVSGGRVHGWWQGSWLVARVQARLHAAGHATTSKLFSVVMELMAILWSEASEQESEYPRGMLSRSHACWHFKSSCRGLKTPRPTAAGSKLASTSSNFGAE
jgi:hypothetical protein